MITSFKPEKYNSVSPYLVVNGAQKMIDTLKKIFPVKELRRFDNPDGTIKHAELRVDDSVIMLADSNEKYSPNKNLLHIYVQDVDKTYKKAIEAGCQILQVPSRHDNDPDKRGIFMDFAGNMWAVGTQVNGN